MLEIEKTLFKLNMIWKENKNPYLPPLAAHLMNTLYLVAGFVRVTFDEAVHIVFEVLDGDLLAVQVDLKIIC